MRNIINLSLPVEMTRTVKMAVKNGNYASVSEFFRGLVRDWMEDQEHSDVLESEREFTAGKGKKLRSLKDLR